uniref:Peptidase aspartic putative domain-containing protein n=1 Tax=Cacopsylla melanoneura TaxID=428564 RepID=A0A8D8M962_9HEMI
MEKLRRSRGGYKSRLTVIQNQVKDGNEQDWDITFIDFKLKEIEDLLKNVGSVQQEIEELAGGDGEFDEEVKKHGEIKQVHEEIYLKLSRVKVKLIKEQEKDDSEVDIMNSSGDARLKVQPKVRLPELKLPTFSGEVTEWLSFSDTFQCLVVENNELTDVQKLQYLKSCLTGHALAEIINLATTNDNFAVAWKLLQDRFQNNKVIVRGYLQGIVNVQFNTKKPCESLREMLTQLKNSVQALDALDYKPDALSEQIIIYLAEAKLDSYLKDRWLEFTDNQEPPTLQEFFLFLEKYCQIFESKASTIDRSAPYVPPNNIVNRARSTFSRPNCSSVQTVLCTICKETHSIYFCPKFQEMSIEQRIEHAKQSNLCYNCLKVGHNKDKCFSKNNCKVCNERHNSLLHRYGPTPSPQLEQAPSASATVGVCNKQLKNLAVLPTAVIMVRCENGEMLPARVLLDSGSKLNFISEELVQQLKLKKRRNPHSLSGIGDKLSSANFSVECSILSRISSYQTAGEFLVLEKITRNLPSSSLDWDGSNLPFDKELMADPEFHESRKIDMLMGCELFSQIIKGNKVNQSDGIFWMDSEFGWICCGRLNHKEPVLTYRNLHVANSIKEDQDLDSQITKFWKVDEFESYQLTSQEDKRCLQYYQETVVRDQDGRYNVSTPIKNFKLQELGDSKYRAEKVLFKIENQLKKNPLIQEQYKQFMDEYLSLGHMERVALENLTGKLCFLPHHSVLREGSLTTKLRVVFNASAKTSTGISLNDCQYTGPRVQGELFALLLRARMHKILLCSDVEKMYRQIWIEPSQQNLQLILWRNDVTQPVQVYRLKTITYGTASAPFLATQTLMQLANDEKDSFPLAAKITKQDFYMDDLIRYRV